MARQSLLIEDFSGGLDLVSSINNIPPGFTPNAKNWRIAEYGGIEKVLGYSAFATLAADAHELAFYAQKDGSPKRLIAATATDWYAIDSAGTATDIHTVTAATNTTFVTYEDKLYGLDVNNNLAVWTGSGSATAYAPGVNTGPPKGIILGVWQNRMWVAKATSAVLGMRVEFSEPADPTAGFANATGLWPADNYIELGGTSGQSEQIVGGMVTGDGLMVFTTGSTYLIYDTDGKYRVVDGERGCVSRKSLSLIGNEVYGITTDGVFRTTGGFPLEIVSRRVSPLFRDETPVLSRSAGVRWGNAYLGAYQRLSSADGNDLALDVDTVSGSIMAHDYPAACWARGALQSSSGEELYFIDASDPTKIREAFDGGSFAGSEIACFYDLPFDNMGDEAQLKRLHRLRAVGRGDLRVACRADYNLAIPGVQRLLEFPGLGAGTANWDNFTWDNATWVGHSLHEGYCSPRTRGRRIQIRLTERSSATAAVRDNLGASIGGALGGAGIFLLEPMFTTSTRRR